ncbi:MAG TPA: FAD-binding oxidoreductase, partial [Polyangia bacterium]|nr:FAD-binding oxidoreductase [Polyangia bacterium]
MPNAQETMAPGDRNRRLVHDLTVDVAIVGGGITGVTTARLLKQAGLTVAVLESRRLGEGETVRTSAPLTEVPDLHLERWIGLAGEERARLAVNGQRRAIERVKAFVKELKIDCQLQSVPAYLFAETADDGLTVEQEAMAARKLRLDATLVDEIPVPFPVDRALRVTDQAQFHPREYLLGLARDIDGQGSHLFERTHVLDIDEGGPCRVTTEMGTVSARHVVLATNVPVSTKLDVHGKVASFRSYALGVEMPLAEPIGLLWDTGRPGHVLRSHTVDGRTYLVVADGDHRLGHGVDPGMPLRMLEDYVASHFHRDVAPTDLRWSGHVVESADGLPLVGPTSPSERVFIATGYGSNGIVNGTLAAMVLADQLQGGRANPWGELFDPARFSRHQTVEFEEEDED